FRRWSFPLVVVGMNSIAIYVMAQLMKPFVGTSLRTHFGQDLFAGPSGSLVRASSTLFVFWLICYWLYRRKIFIKILLAATALTRPPGPRPGFPSGAIHSVPRFVYMPVRKGGREPTPFCFIYAAAFPPGPPARPPQSARSVRSASHRHSKTCQCISRGQGRG